ncbi:putative quinol monooxygenase [Priestia flexa]|uniref:putative quinol monooxygenase n=1 Tax=Priestia flexa TaxID=86664 RepID=UPI001B32D944|nr:putative quinol monooxygenase [Priestia flexa]
MSVIIVTAILEAKPGSEEELYDALLSVLAPSKSESGCIQYDLHRSIEVPSTFVFYEQWRDKHALDEHLSSSHYKDYRKQTEALILNRTVHLLKLVNP